jgi:hypothetical protein
MALVPFLLLTLCALPWLLIASLRFGVLFAGLLALAAVPLLALGALLLSYPTGIPLLTLLLSAGGLLGLVGGILVLRRRSVLHAPSRAAVALWLPAMLGGLAWLVTLAVGRLLPRADVLSWAMNGDSANNIHLARTLLTQDGPALLSSNPVPLPSTLLAVAMSLGRPEDTGAAELLRHDLNALSVFWALAIAATAVLLGLVAASLLSPKRPALIAIASAAGSLLGTTWFISGLPIESGYLNVHIALPLVLASWLAFLRSDRSPALSATLIIAFGVVLLFTWTPVASLSVALLIALGIRQRRRIRAVRPRTLAIATVLLALVIAGVLALALPQLVRNVGAAATLGHGYPFTGWLLVVCTLVAIGGGLALRHVVEAPLVGGIVAVVVSGVVTIAAFSALVPGDAPWTGYYPTKLTYIVTAGLLAIALSVLVRRASVIKRAPLAVTAVGAAVLVLSTLGPAPDRLNFVLEQPLDRILSAKVWNHGDDSVRAVLANTGLDDAVVFWGSSTPDEPMINFWLFEFEGGQIGGNENVRRISFAGYSYFRDTGTYTPPPTAVLCRVVEGLGKPVVVITADPNLEAELEDECPFASVSVSRE